MRFHSSFALKHQQRNWESTPPNVIHPGGINEWFSIFVYGGAAQIKELSIYDRWGSLVWQKQSFPPNELQQGMEWTVQGPRESLARGFMYGAQ
ncbi:MAG: hypothetical protein U0T81_05445 [Saprospiraceae bacterium]